MSPNGDGSSSHYRGIFLYNAIIPGLSHSKTYILETFQTGPTVSYHFARIIISPLTKMAETTLALLGTTSNKSI